MKMNVIYEEMTDQSQDAGYSGGSGNDQDAVDLSNYENLLNQPLDQEE